MPPTHKHNLEPETKHGSSIEENRHVPFTTLHWIRCSIHLSHTFFSFTFIKLRLHIFSRQHDISYVNNTHSYYNFNENLVMFSAKESITVLTWTYITCIHFSRIPVNIIFACVLCVELHCSSISWGKLTNLWHNLLT